MLFECAYNIIPPIQLNATGKMIINDFPKF